MWFKVRFMYGNVRRNRFCGFLACLTILLPEKCEKEVQPLRRSDYENIENIEKNSRYEQV